MNKVLFLYVGRYFVKLYYSLIFIFVLLVVLIFISIIFLCFFSFLIIGFSMFLFIIEKVKFSFFFLKCFFVYLIVCFWINFEKVMLIVMFKRVYGIGMLN